MSLFYERLDRAWNTSRSLVSIGLDPDPSRMPLSDVYEFNRRIVDETFDVVCAYKPNLAFYEALGIPGLKGLDKTLEYIRGKTSDVLLIGDGKRGDIGNSSASYARALFDMWGFDAVTVNAYGGQDSIEPFLQYHDKGVYVWCRSSNPGAKDFQDAVVDDDKGMVRLYELIARKLDQWNTNQNLGLVVGATYPQDLGCLREEYPGMPFLIPGVGAQEGDLKSVVRSGVNKFGRGAIINSSRSVIYASSGKDFAQAARRQALAMNREITNELESKGKGWP
ncbi:orotidine-5'-phosphate decarboxylase [SAR202 cluster bacterium AD-804-J14_MRT_500m]|nr:orotidine-5'-phosphate decarboxylase [SAR202 cluster bacterium AD-804-J14_MRT_500m]